MPKTSRIVYFVSESTGITAESLGESVLSQFPEVEFVRRHQPFLNSPEKAEELAGEIRLVSVETGRSPLVFATMPNEHITEILKSSPCHYYELFTGYVQQVSEDIGVAPSGESGMSHGLKNAHSYDDRMDIVNYTLVHDDAMTLKNLSDADVILVGVSRSGKTPTCLYLALHFGVRAANYPLTDDDFLKDDIPDILKKNQHKLVGLTISPKRLADIREKRRTGSQYAKLSKCKSELNQAQELFIRYEIPVFNTTSSSIEELSARIFQVVTKERGMMPQTKNTYD